MTSYCKMLFTPYLFHFLWNIYGRVCVILCREASHDWMRWMSVTLNVSPRHNLGWTKLLILNFLSLDFERKLRRTLRKGDVDDITDVLSPRALTKCDTNALLMAMEVGHEKTKYSFICCLFWYILPSWSTLCVVVAFLWLIILVRIWYENLLLVLKSSTAVAWRLLHLSKDGKIIS